MLTVLMGCYPNSGQTETSYDADGREHKTGAVGWEMNLNKGYQPAKIKSEEPISNPPPLSEMVGNPPAVP